MLYDPKTGEIREIKDISTEVTFNTIKNASDVVLVAHADEFAKQTKNDFYVDGSPNKNYLYDMIINSAAFTGNDQGYIVPVSAIHDVSVKVKNPTRSKNYPELGVFMLRQLDNPNPLPCVAGLIDSQGVFWSLSKQLLPRIPEMYPGVNVNDKVSIPDSMAWDGYQQLVGNNLILADPLVAIYPSLIDPVTGEGYTEVDDWTEKAPPLTSNVQAERNELQKINSKIAALAYQRIMDEKNGPKKTGLVYVTLGEVAKENGLPFYILDESSRHLSFIKR
jgi:hypothetical protein